MEATQFILLEQNHLERLLRNRDAPVLKNFARFLSAYFANFPLICSRTNRPLPSLFKLAEPSVIEDKDFYTIERQQVSINLPTNYTPSLAAQLLFKCGLLLEAIYFVEQFNDLRSSLIVRYLVDVKCSLNLFDDFCNKIFIEQFFDQLPRLVEECAAGPISHHLSKFVDVLTQISVIFNYDLLSQFCNQLVSNVELLSSGFDEEIPEIVALPRPPVYALPSESLFDRELSKELRLWNELHYSIKLYTLLLQRTNRLNTVLQQTTAWLCRLNVDFETEIPSLIELESTPIDLSILEQFQRILLVVLRTNYRDALCSSIRCNDSQSQIDNLMQTYIDLFPTQEYSNKETLERWAETATQTEFNQVILFFQFIQESNQQMECYLPPLTESTLEKWKSLIFMQTHQQTITREQTISVLDSDEKLTMNEFDFKRLQFIACSLPSFSLSDSSLIQICLQLQPTDFCARAEEPFVDSTRISSNVEYQIDDQQTLKQQIRATIRRLGRQTLTQRAENLHFLPKLLDDFNNHLNADELRSDGQFLATVRDLTAKRPLRTKMTRSLSEKTLIKSTKINFEESKQSEEKEDLADELKAISARLTKIRQKWAQSGGQPEIELSKDVHTNLDNPAPNSINLNQNTLDKSIMVDPLSSGISSSNSQVELPANFFNKHKFYRKRRPKSQANSVSSPIKQQQDSTKEPEVASEVETKRLVEFKIGTEEDDASLVEEIDRTYELEEPQIDNNPQPTIDVLAQLSTPKTPKSIEPLDFSQLSDRDDKPKAPKEGWSEISILEKTPSTTKRIKMKSAKIATAYPDWLTLLPLEDKATSSRLLDLNFQKNKKATKTTPTLQLLNPSNAQVYDSGFLDSEREVPQKETERLPTLSFDMSMDEIYQLKNLCLE